MAKTIIMTKRLVFKYAKSDNKCQQVRKVNQSEIIDGALIGFNQNYENSCK